jgi:nucleoside-diphosphate-sugar epimerase
MPEPSLDDVDVLVTGGAGFIGSHLVDALVARGARVRVLDDLSTGRRENLARHEGRVALVVGDLRDRALVDATTKGVRYVFHQAALGSIPRSMRDPATTIDVNVAGTANVFAAARDHGVARVVYASSSSVYGDSPAQPRVEGREGAVLSAYALSKRMDEQLADVFGRAYGMQLVGLRYFNIYGPRQRPDGPYAAVIPLFMQAHADGRTPTVFGDGRQTRDFTYVDDAVRANLLAAGAPADACGAAYNIGASSSVAVLDLAASIARAWGRASVVEHAPPRDGDVRHARADATRARDALGWTAATTLDEGLARVRAAWPAAGTTEVRP